MLPDYGSDGVMVMVYTWNLEATGSKPPAGGEGGGVDEMIAGN